MFNLFKFKNKDEFISSLSSAKDEIKEQIFDDDEFEGILRDNIRSILMDYHKYFQHDDSHLKNIIDNQIKRIDQIQLMTEKLQTQIETLLNVLRVNSKIED